MLYIKYRKILQQHVWFNLKKIKSKKGTNDKSSRVTPPDSIVAIFRNPNQEAGSFRSSRHFPTVSYPFLCHKRHLYAYKMRSTKTHHQYRTFVSSGVHDRPFSKASVKLRCYLSTCSRLFDKLPFATKHSWLFPPSLPLLFMWSSLAYFWHPLGDTHAKFALFFSLCCSSSMSLLHLDPVVHHYPPLLTHLPTFDPSCFSSLNTRDARVVQYHYLYIHMHRLCVLFHDARRRWLTRYEN